MNMKPWISKKKHEHPAKHQVGTFGYVGRNESGTYFLKVGQTHMFCPQDWAAMIEALEQEPTKCPECGHIF